MELVEFLLGLVLRNDEAEKGRQQAPRDDVERRRAFFRTAEADRGASFLPK